MVRPLRRPFFRAVLIALLAVPAGSPVLAQKTAQQDYLMKLSGLTGRDQEKIVLGAINGQDPLAIVSIDRPTQYVKLRTTTAPDRTALEAAFAPYGISIIDIVPIAPVQLSDRTSAGDHGLTGFPVFHDTGDPATDEAVYQVNKAAWIAAHPDLYPPTPVTTPPSQR